MFQRLSICACGLFSRSEGSTRNLIEKSEILYLDPDKKRTDNWLAFTRLQLPFIPTKCGSIHSISAASEKGNTDISKEQLKAFYDGKLLPSDALYFGETPSTLDAAGLDPFPLAFTTADLRNPQNKRTMSRAAYGLDSPAAWLKNQAGGGKLFSVMDEKRANTFLQTYGAYSATVGEGIRSTGDSVPQNGEKSNMAIGFCQQIGVGADSIRPYKGQRECEGYCRAGGRCEGMVASAN